MKLLFAACFIISMPLSLTRESHKPAVQAAEKPVVYFDVPPIPEPVTRSMWR